ncbi:hypothetical protein BpHYR1_025340 [Brachionus plicatilis]|uniref:Uncharacterized protein n=1 Tax=Brachionus plicatilis TaxID=10195 RepID=A0A3M7RK45_BRAPC|nr:hypothetical protein BpHYR1_025340 [Brachionus plicatilis]
MFIKISNVYCFNSFVHMINIYQEGMKWKADHIQQVYRVFFLLLITSHMRFSVSRLLLDKPDYRAHIFHQNSYHNILNYPNIVLIQKKNLIVQNILLWLKKMLKIEINVYLLIFSFFKNNISYANLGKTIFFISVILLNSS